MRQQTLTYCSFLMYYVFILKSLCCSSFVAWTYQCDLFSDQHQKTEFKPVFMLWWLYFLFPLLLFPFWNVSTGNKRSIVWQEIRSYLPPDNQTGTCRYTVLTNVPQCEALRLRLHELCPWRPPSMVTTLPQPPVCEMSPWVCIPAFAGYFQLSGTACQMFLVHGICHTADKLISFCGTTGKKLKDSTFNPK